MRIINLRKVTLVLFVFVFVFLVYFLSHGGEGGVYNVYVYFADTLLHGKIHLENPPPHFNELVPQDGKFYMVYPPLPGILLVPFVFLFGISFYQPLFSILLGSLNALLFFLLLEKLKIKPGNILWLVFLFAFGTIHWYLSEVGSVWFVAHITSMTFLLLGLNELFGKKRFFLIGLFVSLSFLSRELTVLSFLFFLIVTKDLWLSNKKIKIAKLASFFLPIITVGILSALYNYYRFGSPFEFGYAKIPGVLSEPYFQKGMWDPSYIPRHLWAAFLALPKFIAEPPFIIPRLSAAAIWFTTPAFFWALRANLKNRITIASWFVIIFIFLAISRFGVWGFSQFGYRYAMDFYPFLLLLTIFGMEKMAKPEKMTIILSILINFWGVYSISKLNFFVV